MKKFSIPVILLALAGAILSAALFIEHVNPEANLGFLSCGSGIENPCMVISSSPFAEFLGISTAALGIFFYLVIFFTALIAEDAKGEYYGTAAAVFLPLTAFSLAFDIFLFTRLLAMNMYCTLCIATYGVNAALFVLSLLWMRSMLNSAGGGIAGLYRQCFRRDTDSHRRASVSTYVLFVIMLFAVVVVTSLRVGPARGRTISAPELRGFLNEFYEMKAEPVQLPDGGLSFGDPDAPVTITVFSDYLCSACYEFYRIERYLLTKYRGKVRFVNFIYPLDRDCNPSMKATMYRNSCAASRAVLAASKLGILKEYVVAHFKRYGDYKKGYGAGHALRALHESGNGAMEDRFIAAMKSPEIEKALGDHVAMTAKFKVDATPTFYIAGRRLVGIPQIQPQLLIETIVASEISRAAAKR